MQLFRRVLRGAIRYADALYIAVFCVLVFLYAASMELSPVADGKLLFWIPFLFLVSAALAAYPAIRRRKVTSNLFDGCLRPRVFFWLSIGALAGGVAILLSIVEACFRYPDLLRDAPSFGIRAIATSLHHLVPLETRWTFAVLPVLLLHPQALVRWKLAALLWTLFAVLALTMQSNAALAFLGIFPAIALLAAPYLRGERPSGRLLRKRVFAALLGVLVGMSGVYFERSQSHKNFKIVESPKIPVIAPTADAPSPGSHCAGDDVGPSQPPEGTTWYSFTEARFVAGYLLFRATRTPAQMARLFICLRESGWRPAFRGHQLARLVGVYIPFYRFAYGAFRPGYVRSVNSAVTNAAADAFFNAGYLGVVIAGAIAGFVWGLLFRWSAAGPSGPMVGYFRLYFALLLTQASILSALVGVAPLVAMIVLSQAVLFFDRRGNAALGKSGAYSRA